MIAPCARNDLNNSMNRSTPHATIDWEHPHYLGDKNKDRDRAREIEKRGRNEATTGENEKSGKTQPQPAAHHLGWTTQISSKIWTFNAIVFQMGHTKSIAVNSGANAASGQVNSMTWIDDDLVKHGFVQYMCLLTPASQCKYLPLPFKNRDVTHKPHIAHSRSQSYKLAVMLRFFSLSFSFFFFFCFCPLFPSEGGAHGAADELDANAEGVLEVDDSPCFPRTPRNCMSFLSSICCCCLDKKW